VARPLYIRNISVREVVPLEEQWQTDPELAKRELYERTAQVESLFMEVLTPQRYEQVAAELTKLPANCERWDMMRRLGGQLITLMGFDAVMRMDGYLNFIGENRWGRITPQGIYLIQPFGHMKKRKEIPQQAAVLLNNRLHKVLPFSSREALEKALEL